MLTETELSEDLARLDQLLLAIPEPGMTLGELDGLLCAVIVGPEPILPTEWLPFVWGGDAFDDSWTIDLAELTELVTQRHNAMVHELSEGTFAPLYDIDDLDSDPFWEIWMQGFETGMGLRLKAWDRLLRRGKDDRAVDAAFGMVALLGLSDPEVVQDGDDPEIIEARRTAPEAIPMLATQLYQAHVGRASVRPVRVTAIGRNDPCPCGSGKKYKRCCGA